MFSQSADQPAADQSPAPIGMRELPPQPAKPTMPASATARSANANTEPASSTAEPASPLPATEPQGPGPDDSVIAADDHLEGTFTSRGTIVVKGSVKGRIEAIQLRVEDGARVDADVIVDEAIVAGEFTGNLTCRERLEARPSGRINGRVETHRLMLHEGASVEGEMHMITDSPADPATTIRGSAPLRGEVDKPAMDDAAAGSAERAAGVPAATRTAPTVVPASSARHDEPAPGSNETAAATGKPASAGAADAAATLVRNSVVETLRTETARVIAPRTTASPRGYGYSGTPAPRTTTPGSSRNGKTTTGF
jgi:cytoskeletal protein CcmA (bactofilin family)